MKNKIAYIIYHKDCMDGLASAYITNNALSEMDYNNIELIPMDYNDGEDSNLLYELSNKNIEHDIDLYIVDFYIKDIERFLAYAKNIKIIDHHKTSLEQFKKLDDSIKNQIEFIFDINECGASLCYKHFYPDFELPTLFKYIKDRDLWLWREPNSKEVNTYIRTFIGSEMTIHKFKVLNILFNYTKPNDIAKKGADMLEFQNNQVLSKLNKIKDIKINGFDFKCINATENISELGSEICKKYNTPSCMYFITEDSDLILSFRSLDELHDVSEIAKTLGGGGHRNASGAKLSLDKLPLLLNSKL